MLVAVRCYSVGLADPEHRDGTIFLGDRARAAALYAILEEQRRLACTRIDARWHRGLAGPIDADAVDSWLRSGETPVRDVILEAACLFGCRLSRVMRGFLATAPWQGVERIVVGGGLAGRQVGRIAISVARGLMAAESPAVDVVGIALDPDEAALVGSIWLVDPALLAGCETMLAVDLGGTKVRVGLLELAQLADGRVGVRDKQVWRHTETVRTRDGLIDGLAEMIDETRGEPAARASGRHRLSGPHRARWRHPGRHPEPSGRLVGPGFNLLQALQTRLFKANGGSFDVDLHNDAVAQGLSALPAMRDVRTWAVVTTGTGLGNAVFENKDVTETRA